jgi:hypothetical protein
MFLSRDEIPASVLERLIQHGGDPGCLRPWKNVDRNNMPTGKCDGRSYYTVNSTNPDGSPGQRNLVTNSPALLRKDEWILLDEAIVRVSKLRLRGWKDLMVNGLRYGIPNGMAKTVLQYQNVSDISDAVISMDGMRQSEHDRPVYDLVNLPLPIIHKDFSFPARELMASRTTSNFMTGGAAAALDLTNAMLAARRCAEQVEKLYLGVVASYTFGGGTVYGLTNFPNRATKVMTAPTGLNAGTTLSEVLAMRLQSQQMFHFGPWMLYASLDWDPFLDNDYILTGGNVATQTLRRRLAAIDGIMGVMTLDYLPANTMALVEMNPEVVRGVVGMDMTTVSWESHGGLQANFKVLCIMVPQLRADQNNNTGIVIGTHP